jgi:hypothetical protein
MSKQQNAEWPAMSKRQRVEWIRLREGSNADAEC